MQSALIRGAADLQEVPESPQWSFTKEKGASLTRTFRAATFQVAMDNRPLINSFGIGAYAGLRITDVQVKQLKGGMGELSWTMEGALLTNGLPELPPDKCTCEPAKQEFRLASHPRYDIISDPFLDAINAAISASKEEDRQNFKQKVASFTPFNGVNLAQELLDKMIQGQTHYVLYMHLYKWVVHSVTQPTADAGGYPQNPYGPIIAPSGGTLGWLREADGLEWTGSYWELTRTWQAGINIDTNIYPVVAS